MDLASKNPTSGPNCDARYDAVKEAGARSVSFLGRPDTHHPQRRGVDHEAELISRAGLKDVCRVVEHYGLGHLATWSDLLGPRFVITASAASITNADLRPLRRKRHPSEAHGSSPCGVHHFEDAEDASGVGLTIT